MTDAEPGGRLTENLMHFARTLRAAGLPIGPGKVLDAVSAVEAVGIANREDFYWTLHAVFVNRQDQKTLFDQAFQIFWRNPHLLERMMGMLLPRVATPQDPERQAMTRRLAEALNADKPGQQDGPPPDEELEIDAVMTVSDREILQQKDFEQMSAEEVAAAQRAIAAMRLDLMDVPTRRFRPAPRGRRIDMRATLRHSLRSGDSDRPRRSPWILIDGSSESRRASLAASVPEIQNTRICLCTRSSVFRRVSSHT